MTKLYCRLVEQRWKRKENISIHRNVWDLIYCILIRSEMKKKVLLANESSFSDACMRCSHEILKTLIKRITLKNHQHGPLKVIEGYNGDNILTFMIFLCVIYILMLWWENLHHQFIVMHEKGFHGLWWFW